jgi:predicted HAD superfamily Cof-like phosphohydrolase
MDVTQVVFCQALQACHRAYGVTPTSIIDAMMAEFARHTPEPSLFEARADAYVDIIYYICDSLWRMGFSPDRLDAIGANAGPYLLLIKRFYGAVGEFSRVNIEAMEPHKRISEPAKQVPFLLKMIGSELLEALNVAPTGDVIARERARWTEAIAGIGDAGDVPALNLIWALMTSIIFTYETVAPGLIAEVFDEVHGANMRKGLVGADGVRRFETRLVGEGDTAVVKIIKPTGWVGPDVGAACKRWMKNA